MRAAVGRCPCIIFVVRTAVPSFADRPSAPCEKVDRKSPSFSTLRLLAVRRCEASVMCRYASDVTSYAVPAPTFSVSSGSYQTTVLSVESRNDKTRTSKDMKIKARKDLPKELLHLQASMKVDAAAHAREAVLQNHQRLAELEQLQTQMKSAVDCKFSWYMRKALCPAWGGLGPNIFID